MTTPRALTTPRRAAVPLALSLLALSGCWEESTPGFDRGPVLASLRSDTIVPAFDVWVTQSTALTTALDGLCAAPDAAKLEAARVSWAPARLAAARVEPVRFGPAMNHRTFLYALAFPVNVEGVGEEIGGEVALDAAWAENIGADRKGLMTIEHLLFDAALTPDALIGPTRRCVAMVTLARDVTARAQVARDDWAGAYGDGFVAPSSESMDAQTEKAALDLVVNAMLTQLEVVKNDLLGRPLGEKAGGTPQPEEVRGRLSGNGRAIIIAQLRGIRALYTGGDSAGAATMQAHVSSRNAALSARFVAELDAAIAAIDTLNTPLASAVVDDTATILAAQELVRTALRTLKAEIVSTLGVTLSFNDNDGD